MGLVDVSSPGCCHQLRRDSQAPTSSGGRGKPVSFDTAKDVDPGHQVQDLGTHLLGNTLKLESMLDQKQLEWK